jgi:hypothetical protein
MAVERLPKLNFSIPFAMTSALPLDANSYFESLEAAMTAAESAEQAGSSATQYYFGQNIIVVEDNEATLYIIQPDKTLKPVGSGAAADVEVDGKSITSSAGILALKGFSSALTNQQVRVGENGELEWFTPDNSAVEDLQTEVGQLQTAVDGINTELANKADTNDVYTKTETDAKIDAAISGVYTPTGSSDFANLPTPGADNLGDVIIVNDGFTTDDKFVTPGQEYPAGTNVVVVKTGSNPDTYKYEILSTAVDLTDYLTKTEASTTYLTKAEAENKVDKKTGYSLIQDTLITKLNGLADIKSVSNEFTLSEEGQLNLTVSQDKVTGLTTALDSKVDKVEGKGLSTNDFTNELKTKLDGIQAGAQTNVLESVKLNGQALPISEKAVDIPVASSTVLGIVKGTDAENGVVVNGDGTMVINKLNVNQLVQTEGDELILNGGNSN